MPRIKLDPDGILSLRGRFQQERRVIDDVEQDIVHVLNNLDMEVASSEGIRSDLADLQRYGRRNSEQFEMMIETLDRVNSRFISTDRMITEQAKDIQGMADWILYAATHIATALPLPLFTNLNMADEVSGLFGVSSGNSTPISLDYLLESPVSILSEIKSGMGNIDKLTDIYSLFSDSEFMQTLGDYAGEIGKDPILKVASYLDDGKDLIDAIASGDTDTLESLIEKYSKKGVQFVTGFKNPFSSIYLDIGWNIGENAVESGQKFAKDPSLDNLLSLGWNVTGGALIDAGQSLASETLDFVYGLVGADFDEQDFNNAMEYLGDSIVETCEWVGGKIGEGIVAVGDAIIDGASAISDWWSSIW